MAFSMKNYLTQTILFAILIVAFFVLFSPHQSYALDIQNLDYQMDDQITSKTAEHIITFDSLSPIVIGNSVSIAFPAEFVFPNPTVQSDVDVKLNGALLNVSDWSYNNALNTVFVAFQTTALAGSDVEIILTTDLDLINPPVTDAYDITFGVNGSFVATAEVWIYPQSSITVSAAVLGDPIVVGGGSSGGGSSCYNCFFNDTQPFFDENGIILSFKGYGAPKGIVQVSVDDKFVGTTTIDEQGIFLISVDNISSGLHILKFKGYDKNNVSARAQIITLTVGDRGFVYANDIFLPPTITVEPRGDYGLVLYGYTVPYADVDLNVDGFIIGTVVANGNGLYFVETSLDQFTEGEHAVLSLLKGTTRNLNSGEKKFNINSIYNSDELKLEFSGEPLFDVLISSPVNKPSSLKFFPYIIAFLSGVILLWILIMLLNYRKRRGPYISDYEEI